uniref:Uncharacterized protein n=1 Tax=Amphimedon queenslandica TaxID=400682 RepID=A0A1X7VTU6_AMPQE
MLDPLLTVLQSIVNIKKTSCLTCYGTGLYVASGINKDVQRSLLTESKLTSESALDTAMAAEAAAYNCKQLQERQKPQLPVN